MVNSKTIEADGYREHIRVETEMRLSFLRLPGIISQTARLKSSSCIDENCLGRDMSGQFPGALLGLEYFGKAQQLYKKLYDSGAVDLNVFVHGHCGLLFTYLGLVTQSQQTDYVESMKSGIEGNALQQFGIHINWMSGGMSGTAEVHMDG